MAVSSSLCVVQISDTLLIEQPAFFLENWARLVEAVNARSPDLVIHTGDISFDGAQDDSQLKRASERLRDFDCESLVVPGNHDVGELPGGSGQLEPDVSAESCERFAAHFGHSRFQRDLGAWRLVGVNALLLGSGIEAEAQEWQLLEEAVASAGDRRLALFLHKPLYIEGPGTGRPPNMLTRDASERMHELIQNNRVELVASGHLHEHRIATIAGVQHVWAPSTGFVTDEAISTPIGTRRVGFVQHLFGPGGVESEIVCPAEMTTHQFLDHPDMYPRYQEAARRAMARRQAAK